MTELWQKLQPYVSVFSAALPLNCEHGDTVTVGGKVTSILNMMEIMQDSTDEGLRNEGIYITLDDGIGENNLCLAQKAYKIFQAKYGEIKVGDVLLAEGKVYRLDTTHSYEGARGKKITVDKHKTETLRVLAYDVVPFRDEEPKKVVEPKVE
jgi:hypothetical protein